MQKQTRRREGIPLIVIGSILLVVAVVLIAMTIFSFIKFQRGEDVWVGSFMFTPLIFSSCLTGIVMFVVGIVLTAKKVKKGPEEATIVGHIGVRHVTTSEQPHVVETKQPTNQQTSTNQKNECEGCGCKKTVDESKCPYCGR